MAATSSVASSSAGTLDVASLVSQLMTVERQPIDKLNTKIESYQTKISSFGTIKGLVSGFQTALQSLSTSLQAYSATPTDTSILSASATSTAAAGTYSLSVTTLAQAHKLAAAGQVSDTSAIATGASTATFTVGTTSTDITIAAGATLQDIRAAINAANIGVTATIVNDGSGSPYRLALSSDNSGTSNAISSITVQAGGDAAVNNLLAYNPTTNAPAPAPLVPMVQTVAAQNADFTVNGIQVIKSSNTVTDAIQGVTLNLSKSGVTNLKVARDTGAISTAAASIVDTYNAMANQLKSRSAYGSATKATPELAGDGTVRMMLDQLRGILGTPATPASGGSLTSLSQVGINIQSNGSLKLDSSKLNSAMATNFSDVTNLFSSATGFVTRLSTWTDSVVQTGGLIDVRTQNISNSIKGYNEQVIQLESKMTVIQKRYTTQYSNLNLMLNKMNSTSAYLTQQFNKTGA
ncbi:MAG: flagellar hook-associated protein 2 [Gallionellaceae bacterium]|nr:MAG: flagellar hook-associated protein 2 [Gallionellaceae bacterium]